MTQTLLTTTNTALQTFSVPSDWNSSNNTIEGIGPGGSGSVRISASVGGVGGGGGSYAKRSNVSLTPSGSVYYMLPAGGSAVDAWFNDLNRALQTDVMNNSAPWTVESGLNATVATGQTDPFGGTKATKYTETTTANDFHGVYQQLSKPVSVATPMAFLAWAKPSGTARFLEFSMYDDVGGVGLFASINLSNGTGSIGKTDTGWSAGAVTVTAASNGFYRILLTGTVNTAGATFLALSRVISTSTVTSESYTGDGTSGIIYYGWNVTYGTSDKGFTPTTTTAAYSIYAKAGTTATITVAGAGQAGSIGDTTFQGGNGFKATTATGGGGGGAAGPSGAGGNAPTGGVGGTADNGTVTGGAVSTAGNSGTEWGTAGAGSGAGGRSGTTAGLAGGVAGGGGSGSGTTSGQAGGAGARALIVVNYTAAAVAKMRRTRSAVGTRVGSRQASLSNLFDLSEEEIIFNLKQKEFEENRWREAY